MYKCVANTRQYKPEHLVSFIQAYLSNEAESRALRDILYSIEQSFAYVYSPSHLGEWLNKLAALILIKAGWHCTEISGRINAAYEEFTNVCVDFNKQIRQKIQMGKEPIIQAFKASFPDWLSFLSLCHQSLAQDRLIKNILCLFKTFPDESSQHFSKAEMKNIPGLCRGLAIAFEEAYVKGSINKHIKVYTEIASWNQKSTKVTVPKLSSWLDFIKKVMLYQHMGGDILKEDPILNIGANHLFRKVKDKKCLFGAFDHSTMEKVLSNPLVEQTLSSGMILVYFYCDNKAYHAISIRRVKESWYLYDPSQHSAVKYFPTTSALSIHLTCEISVNPILIFVSFDKLLKPDAELINIANHTDRLYGHTFHDLFMMKDHNPIASYNQIIKEENFFHIVTFGFFDQFTQEKCTILHIAFIKQAGHLCIPLFRYAAYNFPLALQIHDSNGYTPFMVMFLHDRDVVEAVLEILYEYPDELLKNLEMRNQYKENALYLAACFNPESILVLFSNLTKYKSQLIDLMLAPQGFWGTALWAFCKKARRREIRELASLMPEVFCALPESLYFY